MTRVGWYRVGEQLAFQTMSLLFKGDLQKQVWASFSDIPRCSCQQIWSTWHLVTDSTNHCCMWSCHPIFRAWRLAMNSLPASRMWSCPGICGSWRLVEGTINLLNVLCCQRCLKNWRLVKILIKTLSMSCYLHYEACHLADEFQAVVGSWVVATQFFL